MVNRFFYILSFLWTIYIHAVSIDGTTTISYQTSSYTFSNGDSATGFVAFQNGLSIPAGGNVQFNILPPIAGTINLNTSGTMTLNGPIICAPLCSFSSGGIINGQGNTIFLTDTFMIKKNTTLSCASNVIIDGQGHDFIFENSDIGSLLLIDGPENTQVTLRNMIIKGARNYTDGNASIMFGNNINQQLILDNVTVCLDDDIYFIGGGLTIKNNVLITGAYKDDISSSLQPKEFIYLSANDCLIQSHATLTFDMTVAFVYVPVDNSPTHLIFTDYSSRLCSIGSTIYAPSTIGLLFTKGHLIIDHKSFLQSDSAPDFTNGFTIGDQATKTSMLIDILPGAHIEILDAKVTYENER